MSNHIADTNKMVDTPRTDDRVVSIDGNPWVNAPFARGLERELNAANQHIQRLEEAGDTMANAYRQICYDAYDDQQVDNWFKAKEAKP